MRFLYFLIVISIFLVSCTRPYYIETNTYADLNFIPCGFEEGLSFAIVCENNDDSSFSKEVSYKISCFLKSGGFHVCHLSQSQYVLVFSSHISSSLTTVAVPIYIPGPLQFRDGYFFSDGCPQHYHEVIGTGTTIIVPEEIKVYDRQLCLKVYETHKFIKGIKDEIWWGESKSSGLNADFRDTIDYLLVMAFRFFGQNTQRTIHTSLDENDAVVKWLKGSY